MKSKDNLPARPFWTGFLKLSLVTCGVRLYTATVKAKTRFHRVHGPTGEPVIQPWQVKGIGEIDAHDVVKGYEYTKGSRGAKGQSILFHPDELKELRIASTDVIDIAEFVADIDPVYYGQPYYLVPEGGASEQAYRTIYEALRRTGTVALGQVVINERERVIAIRVTEHGLIANTLNLTEEVRDPAKYYLSAAAVDQDEVGLMEQIISRKLTAFQPDKFVDHYEAALHELIEARLAGVAPAVVPVANPSRAGDLMTQLKASMEAEGIPVGGKGKAKAPVQPKAAKAAGKPRKPAREVLV